MDNYDYELLIAGRPTPFLKQRLLSLQLAYSLDGIDQLSLTFDDRSDSFDQPISLPKIGTTISVSLGYNPNLVKMGTFYVDSWNYSGPPNTLQLTAKSLNLHGSLFTMNRRIWNGRKSLGEIIKELAKIHGLTPSYSGYYDTIKINDYQNCESDVSFLSRLATQHNAYFKIHEPKLLFRTYDTFENFSGQNLKPTLLPITETMRLSVSYQERQSFTKVQAGWRNPDNHKYGVLSYPPNASDKKIYCIREMFYDEQTALNEAIAQCKRFERNKENLEIGCKGNPNLTVGGQVHLMHFRDDLNKTWVIEQVSHTLDRSGFHTNFQAYHFADDGILGQMGLSKALAIF